MWLEKLRYMKDASGLTTREIAAQSGIPEPTLEKLFAGATKDPKLTTIQQVVHFLGYTLDDLDGFKAKKAPSLSDEALEVAAAYEDVDPGTQGNVRKLLDLPPVRQSFRLVARGGQTISPGTPASQEEINKAVADSEGGYDNRI